MLGFPVASTFHSCSIHTKAYKVARNCFKYDLAPSPRVKFIIHESPGITPVLLTATSGTWPNRSLEALTAKELEPVLGEGL